MQCVMKPKIMLFKDYELALIEGERNLLVHRGGKPGQLQAPGTADIKSLWTAAGKALPVGAWGEG